MSNARAYVLMTFIFIGLLCCFGIAADSVYEKNAKCFDLGVQTGGVVVLEGQRDRRPIMDPDTLALRAREKTKECR